MPIKYIYIYIGSIYRLETENIINLREKNFYIGLYP